MMSAVVALTPLHDALAELELAAALVLLAEQEMQPVRGALPRLRSALADVHIARALAVEMAHATGRPTLSVLDSQPSGGNTPEAA